MGEVIEKIRWADLPNLALSKDLRGVGLEQVICFEHEEYNPKYLSEYLLLKHVLHKRQVELNAAICIKKLDTLFPEKYELWFTRKSMNDFKWADSEVF